MSIFEAGMMICFGAGWPVAVYKTYRAKCVSGKSIGFSYLVVIGYLCGIVHKILYSYDYVIWLYIINTIFVVADMFLWYRYKNNKVAID